MTNLLKWTTPDLALAFVLDDGPVRLAAVRDSAQSGGSEPDTGRPLVEVAAVGHGHSSNRQVGSVLGGRLRYAGHEETETTLRIVQEEPATGLRVTSVFEAGAGVRAWTEASMTGPGSLELTGLTSLVVGLSSVDAELYSAANSWMAENRWSKRAVRDVLADIVRDPHHHVANSRYAVTSTNSWSTGEVLPIGVLVDTSAPYALGWQIEHNGPWHYEIGETAQGGYLLLSGPTDLDHQCSVELTADKPFRTVPVSLVAGTDADSVFAALTRQRRTIRVRRPVDDRLPIVFNDYMNTLQGDPTTEKLLPLIDAAADVGADYFCIDAGWYAEGDWWNTV
ncbi:MAG TPA: alpha-galactosidase, partial [Kribbella sp.]|nr:alpha-galactosidase [Kribbella sp.]